MPELDPVTQTFLTILDNQVARTVAALKDVREDVLAAAPGGKTRSIMEIGRHLLSLRKIQLRILDPARVEQMPDGDGISSLSDLRRRLTLCARLLRQAILEHDPPDWWQKPKRPRKGVWGDQPTAVRLVRPLNDFTSHVGDIRTVRSVLGNPVGR